MKNRIFSVILSVILLIISADSTIFAMQPQSKAVLQAWEQTETRSILDDEVLDEEFIAPESSNALNEAVKSKILTYKEVYPEGSVWGNEFHGWFQCCGFALKMASEVFGGHWPRNLRSTSNGGKSDGWTCYWIDSSNCHQITAEPGDIIDCPTGISKNHTAMVVSVDNGRITCVQANYAERDGKNNVVHWTECFNYNSNRATLPAIYNVYGVNKNYIQNDGVNNTRKLRLWKPSEELKNNAVGAVSKPHDCDFNGSYSVQMNGNTLKISGNASDYHGINWVNVYIFYEGGYDCPKVTGKEIFSCEYTMPKYGEYTIAVQPVCNSSFGHNLDRKNITYSMCDTVSPVVKNVRVINTGKELQFQADVSDDTGVTESWMIAKDNTTGSVHRFEAVVSGSQVSGTWSSGYFEGFGMVTVTVYAKDAGGNIGTASTEAAKRELTITPERLDLEVNGEAEINALLDTIYFVDFAGFDNKDTHHLLNVAADGFKAKVKAEKPGVTSLNFEWRGTMGARELSGGDSITGGAVFGFKTVCIYIVPNAPVIISAKTGAYDTIQFKEAEYADTYFLYRKVVGMDSEFQLVKEFADDGSHSVQVKSPENGTSYFYKMCAKSAAVEDIGQEGCALYVPTSSFSGEVYCVKNAESEDNEEAQPNVPPIVTDAEDSSYDIEDRKDLSAIGGRIECNTSKKTYDGYAFEPTVKVTVLENGRQITLTEGADYRVLYENNTDAGTDGKVIVRGNGLYKGELTASITITPKSVRKLKVESGSMITGEQSAPPVKVYDGAKLLREEKDYALVYNQNMTAVPAQAAKVIICGKNNYTDSVTVKISVYEKEKYNIIQNKDVTLSTYTVNYTGSAIKNVIPTVKAGDVILTPKRDYKIQYKNNKNVGTAFVIITGKGQYKGKVVKSFEIIPVKTEFSIGEISSKIFNGKLQKPSVTVKAGKKRLLKNRDYTVSYENNFHAGIARIIINGRGNYQKMSGETTFIIKPQKISKVSAKVKNDKLVILYGNRTLQKNIDYTLAYLPQEKNKIPIIITGKGDFTTEAVIKKVKPHLIDER